jgi:recombination protein RecA
VDRGILKKSWAFYSYGETKLGQGRENAREFLRNNPKLLTEIEKLVRAAKK